MESVHFSKHGHWEVRASENCACICCPVMKGFLSFGQKREIYQEFKTLELKMQMDGKRELIAFTGLIYPEIMKMLTKVGFTPFRLSLEKDILWFRKDL